MSALAGCNSSGETQTLTIGYQPICAQYWSELVVKNGELAEQYMPDGYELEWQPALQGSVIGNRMQAGQNQIGYNGDMPSILMMLSEETPISMISLSGWSRGQQCNVAMISDHVDVEEVGDLEGRDIYVTTGTCTHRFILELLDREGIDANIIDTGINEVLAGLRDDQIGVAGVWEPNASLVGFQQEEAEYFVSGVEYDVPDCGTIEVTDEFLSDNREAVKAFLKGQLEAHHIMRTDQEQTLDYVEPASELEDFDRSTLEGALYTNIARDDEIQRFHFDTQMNKIQPIEELLTSEAPDFLQSQGIIDEVPGQDRYKFGVLEEAIDELGDEVDWEPEDEQTNWRE